MNDALTGLPAEAALTTHSDSAASSTVAAASESPAATPKLLKPKRQKARDRSFVPIKRHAVFEFELCLRTEPASKVFENTHEPAQSSLFMLQEVLPQQSLSDSSVIDPTLGYLRDKFDEIEKELSNERERLNVVMQECGARVARVYTHAEPVTIQAFTPMFGRYMGLVQGMDEVMQLVDGLWFSGRVQDKQRSEMIQHWRNRLMKFSREITSLQVRARAFAMKLRDRATPMSKDAKKAKAKAVKAASAEVKRERKTQAASAPTVEQVSAAA